MVDHVLLNRVGAPQLLRLDTLVKLRWLAVTGQMLAIIVVHFGFGFPLPILTALAIIAVSALLNIALQVRFPRTHRIEDGAAATLLAYDVVQLAALLYLTGGLENPFSILFLAPVLISATALPPTRTMLLGALATVAVTVLAVWHQPLPWLANDTIRLPRLYVGGVWLSLLLGLTFIGVYAWRVAEEARQLGHALTATELVLAREQHLSQLDGLAAAAAHELGTPLATIALVVRELDRAIGSESPHKDDIVLLSEQTSRCRQILAKIATLGTEPEGLMNTIGIRQLLEEVSAPQRPFGVRIVMEAEGPHPDPVLLRSAGLIYGLENLIDNAVDFATTTVSISAAWTDQSVSIMITDDGPGFAVEVLKRLGEPYVTTRRLDPPSGNSSGGLGLGLFIAKTLLERGGAQFEARNRTDAARGAAVKLTWKRAVFERRGTSALASQAGASAMGHPVTVP